jgi:serine/threonine protein kinase
MGSPLPSRYVGPERIHHAETTDVYSALDRQLGRKVAIKILSPHAARDEQRRTRLRREAMAVARLSHVLEVVSVYDVGDWRGRPYMAMEFLGGGSLASRVERGRVTGDMALRWLWQAAVALDAAHELGIVHRDVTPFNLLLDVRDNVRLTDFGIATSLDGAAGAVADDDLIEGTRGFIAPEHLAGEAATPASDVYGLGAVAQALLAAAPEIYDAAPEVELVLSQATAAKPADRFGSAQECVQELATALVPDHTSTQVFHGAATEVFTRPTRVFSAPPKPEPKPIVKTSPILPLVAVERLVRAAVLIAVGLTAMLLQNHPEYSIRSTALRLDLALNPLQHFYDAFSGVTQWVSPHDFFVIGVVAFVLGGLYAIEAIGLAYRAQWAVLLTVVTTVALIPVEIGWLWHHPGRLKEVALAVNVAVAVLLAGTVIRASFAARRASRHTTAAARVTV